MTELFRLGWWLPWLVLIRIWFGRREPHGAVSVVFSLDNVQGSYLMCQERRQVSLSNEQPHSTIALFSANAPRDNSDLFLQTFSRQARPLSRPVGEGKPGPRPAIFPIFSVISLHTSSVLSFQEFCNVDTLPSCLLPYYSPQILDFCAVPVKHHWTICSLSPKILFISSAAIVSASTIFFLPV